MNKRNIIDHIKNRIDNYEVISFDIFDTLLLRPYYKPADLFKHLEMVYEAPFFSVERIRAEQKTRKNNLKLEDITFDMIYEEVAEKYKDIKRLELEWEEMTLRSNPELKMVYDYALSMGKKIIIASDMYLSSAFLSKVLRKNGYHDWHNMYVSCECNAGKYSGKMFKHILSELEIPASKVLHIGDNKHSDVKIPTKLGIATYHYNSLNEQFIQSHKRIAKVHKAISSSLGGSIIFSMVAYDWLAKRCGIRPCADYWSDLGYQYAGPLAYGYVRFVEHHATQNNINNLLFVARDGYILQEVFKIFNKKILTHYIYAPRFMNLICRLDYFSNSNEPRAIVEFFANKKNWNAEKDCTDFHKHIENNKDSFTSMSNEEMASYRTYIKSHIENCDNLALVDTITGAFSSQKLIQAALEKEILGLYWGICMDDYVHIYNHNAYMGKYIPNRTSNHINIFTSNWNFVEFLISSPEHPVKFVSDEGLPVYDVQQTSYEKKRAELYPLIARGAIRFAEEVQHLFAGHNIFIDGKNTVEWLEAFIQYPSREDFRQMSTIKISEDSAHSKWIPLFCESTSLRNLIISPRKTIKSIKKLTWKTPLQHLLLCITSPASIRMKGIRKIDIAIFNHFRRRFFDMTLFISKDRYFRIGIGSRDV